MNNTVNTDLQYLLSEHPELASVKDKIKSAFSTIYQAFSKDKFLFLCGNGGSAADSEHIAAELLKGFLQKRPLAKARREKLDTVCRDPEIAQYLKNNLQQGCRAISLTSHIALSTAMSNDVGADLVFAQQLNALGKKGDVLLAISTSGNARNVELCAQVARSLGIIVIGLTGEDGGRLKQVADVLVNVPARETARVQELHLPVYHTLCAMLEKALF
ncbi:MAG: SIS domain-containing protein [Lentisphaeria bacterium]